MTTPPRSPPAPARRWWPLAAAALALAPLLWCYTSLRDLWWFGDDWELLDRMKHFGIWRWTLEPFAENFVPLFKVLWGHLVFASGGSYAAMIAALWATHALNAALFARWLGRAGFGVGGTALAVTIFAVTAGNAETLAWAVQWSAALAVAFFLLAAEWQARAPATQVAPARAWRLRLVLALCCAASALSFSRGVLTGAVLAMVCLLPFDPGARWPARWKNALACIIPSIVVAVVILRTSPGQAGTMREHWREAVEFGAWYWAATPLHRLLEPGSWGWRTTLLLALLKLALVVWALRRTSGAQRQMLVTVLLLDLGNAALLGIGRYHTGLPAVTGSRYQYLGLLCTLPFVAVAFDALLARVRFRVLRAGLAAALVGFAAWRVAREWPHEAELFATHRGRNTRQILLHDPNPPEMGAVPGIPFLSTPRAKELIARYHLH